MTSGNVTVIYIVTIPKSNNMRADIEDDIKMGNVMELNHGKAVLKAGLGLTQSVRSL